MTLFKKESFPPFPSSDINNNCWDFLILGKAPGQKSLDNKSYFYDSRNRFRDLWKVKGLRGNIVLQEKFLNNNGIIIWDRMKYFYSKDDSSSDERRNASTYNDIRGLIENRKPKNYNYPTIVLLGTTMKDCMDFGAPTYINFIGDEKYSIEDESGNRKELFKKTILNLSKKNKILIRGCGCEKNFKPFRLVACNDTSGGCRKDLNGLLKNWKKSGLECLDI